VNTLPSLAPSCRARALACALPVAGVAGCGGVVLALLLACAAPGFAQALPKMKKFAPGGLSFSIDIPEKDWNLVPGGDASLVIVVQRRFEAVVVVERTPLQVELAPEDIGEVFLSLEAEQIREFTPSATDIKADLQEVGTRRVAAFVFTRSGVLGREKVLQYSMPAGKVLYRIVAVARADAFDKSLPLLQAIATSVAPM
jgi:hypothetical protein